MYIPKLICALSLFFIYIKLKLFISREMEQTMLRTHTQNFDIFPSNWDLSDFTFFYPTSFLYRKLDDIKVIFFIKMLLKCHKQKNKIGKIFFFFLIHVFVCNHDELLSVLEVISMGMRKFSFLLSSFLRFLFRITKALICERKKRSWPFNFSESLEMSLKMRFTISSRRHALKIVSWGDFKTLRSIHNFS